CIGPDGQGGPTIDPCGECEPCRAIAEGRHIDVIEMDAASHTGIDDIREIIEASRYAAVSARYKIYIIDEVHMLSKAAFNGLLKTLEEPPGHVKFLFATTEVNKVPVTVLSRCQRFDLKRIPADLLAGHFAEVAKAEGVEAEADALALVARAAEGSARDGLSILDQAIAHAGIEGGAVTADAVRDMLGLSDRGAIRTLFGKLLEGDAAGALANLRQQYDLGVDPTAVLKTLLETVHGATLVKIGADLSATGQAAEERAALTEWAGALSFPALHRLWQLLLKGHDEVARAALPIETAEMALLRVIHAASLPDPGELARQIANGGVPAPAVGQGAPAAPAAPADPAEAALPASLRDVHTLLDASDRMRLAVDVWHRLRVVSFAFPEIILSNLTPLPADLPKELAAELRALTGKPWKVTLSPTPGDPTLAEQSAAAEEAARAAVLATPMVAAALAAFPGAELAEFKLAGGNQA
ncbi:MAG: DNA polymerase III subunit gamma/tau, partial [Sphingomonadales bacterium]|nr:DNA polymerase III subunit gamma/tau [Sphingomonadales bacterium]